MEKINIHLDDIMKKYARKIGYKLGDREYEDIAYIGLIILEKICEESVNVECGYNLRNKSSVLYNLGEEDFKELIGRAFLSILPHYESRSRIPYDHIRYFEYKVKLIIDEFPHYKRLKESNIEIEKELRKIYQTVGSEILRILKEMKMIEITKIEGLENPLVHVKILDDAYEFKRKYEEYRTTDLEYEDLEYEYNEYKISKMKYD